MQDPTAMVEDAYELASSDGGVDRSWYLQTYPDVANAGADPVEHYLWTGWKEGRDPRPDFSTRGYVAANPAVRDNPLIHYLRYGGTKVPSSVESLGDYELAAGDGGVDRSWYWQTYPDVEAAGVDPVTHYLGPGWRERRDPRSDFSTTMYLEANKEVSGNPLLHYLRHGGTKVPSTVHRRAAENDIDRSWYGFWKKGFLHPKGGQQILPNAPLGSPGVPKILFTGHEATRTGAPRILLRLMEALQGLTGAELYLILEKPGPLLDEYQRIAHVFVNHGGILYGPNGANNLSRVLATIAEPAPTLAVCNSAGTWRLVEVLHEAGLSRLVSIVHERVVHFPADVWRMIHRASCRVILPAQSVKAAMTAVLPELEDAAVVPQGLLDPEFGRGDRSAARAEVRRMLRLSPKAAIILGCGTRDLRKGIDLFVQMAARVRARTTREIHFVWLGAGPKSEYCATLIDLDISLLGLSSVLSRLDEVADPEPYFLAADAFALTSRDDPFPCVVHEAMACALPIVVFDGAGGAAEAIAGGCGIAVPYLDIDAMSAALVSIVESPSQFAEIGRTAESRVRSVYRFSDYAERVAEICGSLSEERRPEKGARSAPPPPDRAAGGERWWRTRLVRIGQAIRAEQWWDYKLAPMFAVFYATLYVERVPVASVWPAALVLLLAVASCAAYVSILNDVTDRADDRRAGKTNRMDGKPAGQLALWLAAPWSIAAGVVVLWRHDRPLVAAYLAAWILFSLYSIPPFRLKQRGVLGVIADACGSQVFPTLTAALLALATNGQRIEPAWVAALALWSLGYGLRGILWHQLYDLEADRKAVVRTFVVRHSRVVARRVARGALFIEILGLAMILGQIKRLWPAALLLVYGVFALMKARAWHVAIVIAEPCERYAILGLEYYAVLLPLGLLLASALRNPVDWIVLGAHAVVFSRLAVQFGREARSLALGAPAPSTPTGPSSRRTTSATTVRHALKAGAAFLESAQLPSGEIPIELASTSDMAGDCIREPVVFPAAVAARALSIAPCASRVWSRALDFLLREMEPDGLWRHPSSDKPQHYDTPLDVDDTSLASAALLAAGREIPDNRHLLLANREDDGLFRTWIVRWRPYPLLTRRFFRHTAETRDVDSVVNANVVFYLGSRDETRPAIDHMLDVLRTGREMMSTVWYGSRFTVWYFFSHALHAIAPEAGEIIVPRINATTPANALELALATSTLLLWNQVPDVGPLLEAQLPSGAWPSAGFYHMGQRRMEVQPKPPWWGSEALTTVFAVEALSHRLLR